MNTESIVDCSGLSTQPAREKSTGSASGFFIMLAITACMFWVVNVLATPNKSYHQEWSELTEDFSLPVKELSVGGKIYSAKDHRELLHRLRALRSTMATLPYSTKWDIQLSPEESVAYLFTAVDSAIRSLEVVEGLDYASSRAHRVAKRVKEQLRGKEFSYGTASRYSLLAMEAKYGWEKVKEMDYHWRLMFLPLVVPLLFLVLFPLWRQQE
jgi:hypothetical protein